MHCKFEDLEVYQLAFRTLDRVYSIVDQLPGSERFNLKEQTLRAATSVVLNIAEGSTGSSDIEQNRFLGIALRSLMEVVACMRIMQHRGYAEPADLQDLESQIEVLFAKLQRFRQALMKTGKLRFDR